jgi:hypothetical protein
VNNADGAVLYAKVGIPADTYADVEVAIEVVSVEPVSLVEVPIAGGTATGSGV